VARIASTQALLGASSNPWRCLALVSATSVEHDQPEVQIKLKIEKKRQKLLTAGEYDICNENRSLKTRRKYQSIRPS
jgi:hypothetical protein